MTEAFYTPEQLVAMIRFTDHSKCRGKSVYAESSSLLRAFRFACDQYRAINGDDNLGQEYTQSLKRRAFSRELIDRIFPYIAGIKNSKGLPMKFVDYEHSAPVTATEISTVPPIDGSSSSLIPDPWMEISTVPPIDPAAQRELEKELAEIYMTIDAIDLNSDPFPVDLRDAAKWLGYSQSRHQKTNAKAALMSMRVTEGVDYLCLNIQAQNGRGGHNAEQIRLTSDCFKTFCLRAGTKRAERVREYFIAAEQRFRAAFSGDGIQISSNPGDLENVIRRVVRDEAEQQLTAAVGELGENLCSVEVKVLTVLEIMQQQFNQQFESLKLEVTKSQTPAVADLKRRHGRLYQQVLEQHYRFKDGIHCPCCNKATTAWEGDHWRSKADSSRSNGWKICRPCNEALGAAGDSTKRDPHKNKFDAFQLMCDNYEQATNERDGTQLGLSIF